MQLLIKNALVIHPASKFHGEKIHLFIQDGNIVRLGKTLSVKGVEVFDAKGARVSPGFFDLGTLLGEPGFEHREDFRSAAAAALAGGFTALACLPNTLPCVQSKSEVTYLKNASKNSPVDFLPIGAISQECKGKDITEMFDMHAAGAVAFSDGKKQVQDSGLMLRALQYVQPFAGVVLNQPLDKAAGHGGQMHEGVVSTSLGLRGFPALAEELMLQRDLRLAEYAGGRLHVHQISTAGSVALVREAKRRGLPVTASAAVMNLVCDDGWLLDFDTNFKVMPPLRSQSDIEALREGLRDGTIDCLTSNHVPLDEEAKNLEFPYAEFGATGLETAFALSCTHLHNSLTIEDLVEKWALAPRRILNLPPPEIEPGAVANLTVFDPDFEWTFRAEDIRSKSRNTPFVGWNFKGKVLAVVHKNRLSIQRQP